MNKLSEKERIVKIFGVLCQLCALCGEKSRTAKHAKSAELPYVRFAPKDFTPTKGCRYDRT